MSELKSGPIKSSFYVPTKSTVPIGGGIPFPEPTWFYLVGTMGFGGVQWPNQTQVMALPREGNTIRVRVRIYFPLLWTQLRARNKLTKMTYQKSRHDRTKS
jgi:hypothetical protein